MKESKTKNPEAKFRFLNFIVNESHIVLKEQGDHDIDVTINPKGFIFSSLNQFHLELNVEVKETTDKFKINIIAVAVFEFDNDQPIEQYKSDFFVINAPAIAFPYIRAYISNLTTQSGLFTVTLPTFNLSSLGETLRQNTEEMA